MSGLSAAPSDSVQPQKTGEQCTEPSRKTQNCCHIFASHYCLFCDTIFDMTPSDLVQVSTGLASRGSCGGGGGGGRMVGCSLCRKVGKKTSTLHSIVPLSVILSLPHLRKTADKQTSQEFCLHHPPLLSAAGSSWMQDAMWVIDYFPPALRTLILMEQWGKRYSPRGVVRTLAVPLFTCSHYRKTYSRLQCTCF